MCSKKILITGGAGFVGSNLSKKLLDRRNKIICMDNLYTGRMENIRPFIDNKKFQFINHDIINPYDIECEEIYNMACPASPPHYQKDPIFTYKTSVFGALNALELANKNNAKVLQASTSEVYGDPVIHPQNEEYWGNVNPVGIRSCYDEGKRGAETLFFDYNRKYNTKIKIVRIFNTYGPNMDPEDGRVVSNFIIQALQGNDLTVYGDGSQTRSFCYIDDLVDGIIALMDSTNDIIGPINMGNQGEFTILELADVILELTKSKSKIVFKPLPLDDPKQRRPDTTKAKDLFNWTAKVSLKDGLEETIKYFRKIIV